MLEFQTEEGTLRVLLKGEIDHHSAGQLREQIDCKLDELLPRPSAANALAHRVAGKLKRLPK